MIAKRFLEFSRRWPALWAPAAAAVLLALGVGLAPHPSMTLEGAGPVIDLDQIRPGMKGYGLTVFQGTEPERFEVEVVAILRNFLLKQDLILVRCKHPMLDEAGVIAGMSGSPIYLEGKLAGALAYGWSFSKEPLAGITPIRNMLEVAGRDEKGAPSRAGGQSRKGLSTLPGPAVGWTIPGSVSSRPSVALAMPVLERRSSREGELASPAPVETPLVLGGFSDGALRELGDALAPFGVEPLRGGGGRAEAGGDAGRGQLVPGGALGVELIRGDLSAVAVGTVTTLLHGRALAFGHPMLNMGPSTLGVTTGVVHAIVKSLYRSFKLADPVADAGVLVQDRQAAILADTTRHARLIPMRIRIADRTGGRTGEYHVEIADHRFLTPILSAVSVRSVLEEGASDLAYATVAMEGEIRLQGGRTVKTRQTLFSPVGASLVATRLRPFLTIADVLNNPFADAPIESIELAIDLRYDREVAYIKGAYLTTESPEPGETVNLHVRIQPYAGPEEVLTLPVKMPDLPDGELVTIEVAGGGEVEPELPPPRGLEDYLSNLERSYPERSLVVTEWLRSSSVLVRGQAMHRLPPSALDSLRPAAADLKEIPQRALDRRVVPSERVVGGSASVEVRIERRKVQ